MKSEQISIFLENKAGRLAQITRVLGEAGVNIRALSLADTSDFGILRLIVSDVEKAAKVLKENGFTVARTSVVAAEVPDRPGGLAHILEVLGREGHNVEYMYAFVAKAGDSAIIIFRFDQPDAAAAALAKGGVRIVEGKELYSL